MTNTMTEDEKIRLHYEDILEGSGLVAVLRTMFARECAAIQVHGFGSGLGFASAEFGERSVAVFLALDERCFLFNFCHRGRKQASGSSGDLNLVSASIRRWLLGNINVDALVEEFAFVRRKETSNR